MKKEGDPGKFRQLDEISYVSGYPGYQQLSSFAEKSMQIVCDFKEIGSTKFFRLNDSKVLSWLLYKMHQLRQVLPTLDKNYAAQSERATLTDAVSIMGEYLKEEPWLRLLCGKLKLSLQDEVRAPVNDIFPSSESGPSSFDTTQEKNGNEKKTTRAGRQTKKAKLEKDSQNIKDMFSRASRRRG